MGKAIKTCLIGLTCTVLCANALASDSKPYINQIVDSIYRAEGGAKTRYPYGILSVKTSNPRKTCYEIVNWRYAIWSGTPSLQKKSFIQYLSESYCPIGASNDPRGLNRHWVKNVSMGVNHV
jgi:hypothetical protein